MTDNDRVLELESKLDIAMAALEVLHEQWRSVDDYDTKGSASIFDMQGEAETALIKIYNWEETH